MLLLDSSYINIWFISVVIYFNNTIVSIFHDNICRGWQFSPRHNDSDSKWQLVTFGVLTIYIVDSMKIMISWGAPYISPIDSSYEIYTTLSPKKYEHGSRFVLFWGSFVVVDFTHIRQGCWAVECWAKCQRRNFQSNELKNHLQYIQNKAEHSNILCIPWGL